MRTEAADALRRHGLPLSIAGTCGIEALRPACLAYARRKSLLLNAASDVPAIILTTPELAAQAPPMAATLVPVGDPVAVFVEVHNAFHDETGRLAASGGASRPESGVTVHPSALVGLGARIGAGSVIEAYAHVGPGVILGPGCRVGPGAVLYGGTRLGASCVIGAGAKVGGPGFRIVRDTQGNQVRLAHAGGVALGDRVEVGSNTIVDRGTFGDTVLEDGVMVDSSVHIGHNVRIGRSSVLCAGTVIGGSAQVGEDAFIALQVVVAPGVKIGSKAQVNMGSVVIATVRPGAQVAGHFAMDSALWNAKWVRDQRKA